MQTIIIWKLSINTIYAMQPHGRLCFHGYLSLHASMGLSPGGGQLWLWLSFLEESTPLSWSHILLVGSKWVLYNYLHYIMNDSESETQTYSSPVQRGWSLVIISQSATLNSFMPSYGRAFICRCNMTSPSSTKGGAHLNLEHFLLVSYGVSFPRGL